MSRTIAPVNNYIFRHGNRIYSCIKKIYLEHSGRMVTISSCAEQFVYYLMLINYCKCKGHAYIIG